MKITVHSSKAVAPDYGERSPPSRTEAITLSVFDMVTFDQYVSGMYFFHSPVPPNDVMEAGFAMALAAYRVWAGRLVGADAATGGCPAILLNDARALFVEATADVELDSVMLLEQTPVVARLHPSRQNVVEPLRVQVTRFMCGSGIYFMVAWDKATHGLPVDDPVLMLDRAAVFVPRQPPRVEFEHRGVEFKQPHDDMARGCSSNFGDGAGDDEVVVHRVQFNREWMSDLKSRASAGAPLQCSTVHCVVAHLWRCVTKTRGLDSRDATAVRIAVNGRSRMVNRPNYLLKSVYHSLINPA